MARIISQQILSNLGRIFKSDFPITWRDVVNTPPTNLVGSPKSYFCPSWTEAKKHLAAIGTEVNFYTGWVVVKNRWRLHFRDYHISMPIFM